MRHRKSIKHLGRTYTHRSALRRNLAKAIIEHERIITTLQKAKFARGYVEKLITTAKKGLQALKEDNAGAKARYLHCYRQVLSELQDKKLTRKLFGEGEYRESGALAARYAERPGGYTRILRIGGSRLGQVTGSSVGEVPKFHYTLAGHERTMKAIGNRLGDNGVRVVFELVQEGAKAAGDEEPVVTTTKKSE
ncbi:MAG TPA: 50S ribosomal protein L17 [Candidatus Brocadiia bacterium]|nr:50S ribosomal protein L17 [Candidatus Brocadiia bacterium]